MPMPHKLKLEEDKEKKKKDLLPEPGLFFPDPYRVFATLYKASGEPGLELLAFPSLFSIDYTNQYGFDPQLNMYLFIRELQLKRVGDLIYGNTDNLLIPVDSEMETPEAFIP